MNGRLAAIDIGTNSALLLIAERRSGVLEPVLQRMAVPRVGRNLAATGVISDAAFRELMEALEEFRGEIRGREALLTGVVATQAFREARNGPSLLAGISESLGCAARILEGPEESRLGYLAVADRHPSPDLAVLDIGGGSTEVTRKGRGMSLPVGAVRLSETCGIEPEALRARAAAAFAGVLETWKDQVDLVAVGGTASALAMLELKLPAFDAGAIEGLRLESGAVTGKIDFLAGLSVRERAALPGMDAGRADILIPGLCILEAFLRTAGCASFRVSDRGIRYGVIIDWLKRQPAGSGSEIP